MGYSFSLNDDGVEPAARRIAQDLIERAVSTLADQASPLPPRIHAARKSVKKLRGLIRLIRPNFAAYDTENAALRKAGLTVASLRNATVMLTVFDMTATAAGLDASALKDLRDPFAQRLTLAEDPPSLQASTQAFTAAMHQAQARAAKWKIKRRGFAALDDGLELTFTAAQKALRTVLHAPDNPAPDLIHLWRKRVKDHWYQCRLLTPIWPEMMAPRTATADTLGILLGDHHDLSELIRLLPESPAAAPLIAAARARQRTLLDQALPLSKRLLAGSPQALTSQWRGWWEIWRDQQP